MKKIQESYPSVFKLTIMYLKPPFSYPAQLKRYVLGYYSSLKGAVKSIIRCTKNFSNSTPETYFKAYEVEEFLLNSGQNEPFSYRIYNRHGKFLNEYKWWKVFRGIKAKDCKFHLKQIVEFLDDKYLNLGVISALPPTPKESLRLLKLGMQLTKSEDAYRVITFSSSVCGFNDKKNKYMIPKKVASRLIKAPFIFSLTQNIPLKLKEKLYEASTALNKI